MLAWLITISIFWPLAALYLGGTAIHFEGGGGVRHSGGLLLSFALFLGAWALLRMALQGLLGMVSGTVAATIAACILIPVLCKLSFRVVGVRIGPAAAH